MIYYEPVTVFFFRIIFLAVFNERRTDRCTTLNKIVFENCVIQCDIAPIALSRYTLAVKKSWYVNNTSGKFGIDVNEAVNIYLSLLTSKHIAIYLWDLQNR
jgi:hypothetical protein